MEKILIKFEFLENDTRDVKWQPVNSHQTPVRKTIFKGGVTRQISDDTTKDDSVLLNQHSLYMNMHGYRDGGLKIKNTNIFNNKAGAKYFKIQLYSSVKEDSIPVTYTHSSLPKSSPYSEQRLPDISLRGTKASNYHEKLADSRFSQISPKAKGAKIGKILNLFKKMDPKTREKFRKTLVLHETFSDGYTDSNLYNNNLKTVETKEVISSPGTIKMQQNNNKDIFTFHYTKKSSIKPTAPVWDKRNSESVRMQIGNGDYQRRFTRCLLNARRKASNIQQTELDDIRESINEDTDHKLNVDHPTFKFKRNSVLVQQQAIAVETSLY